MDEIIINLACLDEEIVPFCGTEKVDDSDEINTQDLDDSEAF